MDKAESRRRSDELLDALELDGLADRAANTLSGGQRRRLDVAIGLVHRPVLLFLDEPSTGLDPQSRANLWDHILRLRRERGMTVVLTTHYLDEADSMAERVMVIDHGEVIADDTADRLKAQLAGDRILLTVEEVSMTRVLELARRTVAPEEVEVAGGSVSLRVVEGAETLPGLLRALDHDGLEVRAAEVRRPTLDDVFLTLTGRSLREEVAA